MSKLRPELTDTSNKFAPTGATAYLMILNAVQHKKGLIHGQLHKHGESCAALPNKLIDEVAAVNDSMPYASKKTRRLRVMKWLKWKLRTLGYTL